ncbi:MAG: HipA N-terminal domain-containing protein [Candidatus Margulisbacteria bacterium]|nr:HipA N-terminal domain-containing protein [Candidatus Margulisiibacteriota bacterium]
MKIAHVYFNGNLAGHLKERVPKKQYEFTYIETYSGPPISLTLPLEKKSYQFEKFPSFFEGLLPEGIQLEYLLRTLKIDRDDYYGQLLAVGEDTVGSVTVFESK